MSGSPHVFLCHFDDCGRTFSKPSRLLHHIRTHTGERPYVCPHSSCDKKYTRSAHLNRHIEKVHTEVKTPRCSCTIDGCGQTFSSQQNFQKHMKNKHNIAKWKCPEEGCAERFRKHHQLKAHIYSHKGVLPFQCDREGCWKKFKQKSHLDRHIKIHQGYKCPVEDCLELFYRWSDLRKHRADDHRPDLKCAECNKSFTAFIKLKRHREIHSLHRVKYVCPQEGCSRSYSEKRNLRAHIRTSHEGRKFICEVNSCGRSFSSKQKCREHHTLEHDPNAVKKEKHKRLNLHRKTSFASKVTGMKDPVTSLSANQVKVDGLDLNDEVSSDLDNNINVEFEYLEENEESQEDIPCAGKDLPIKLTDKMIMGLASNANNCVASCINFVGDGSSNKQSCSDLQIHGHDEDFVKQDDTSLCNISVESRTSEDEISDADNTDQKISVMLCIPDVTKSEDIDLDYEGTSESVTQLSVKSEIALHEHTFASHTVVSADVKHSSDLCNNNNAIPKCDSNINSGSSCIEEVRENVDTTHAGKLSNILEESALLRKHE